MCDTAVSEVLHFPNGGIHAAFLFRQYTGSSSSIISSDFIFFIRYTLHTEAMVFRWQAHGCLSFSTRKCRSWSTACDKCRSTFLAKLLWMVIDSCGEDYKRTMAWLKKACKVHSTTFVIILHFFLIAVSNTLPAFWDSGDIFLCNNN